MIVGGYTLDLYCDNAECKNGQFSESFYSETGEACRMMAREAGWKLYVTRGKAYCKHCKGKCDVR